MRSIHAALGIAAAGSTLVISDEVVKALIVLIFALLTWSLRRVVRSYDDRLAKVESALEKNEKGVAHAIDYIREQVFLARESSNPERRRWALEMTQTFVDRWRSEGFPERVDLRQAEVEG